MRVLNWGKKGRSFDLVAFDPTGQSLAAGGNDQPTVVWDVATGAEQIRFDASALSLQFHPLDGRLFFSTEEGLQGYDKSNGTVTVVIPGAQYGVAPPAFASNEDWVVHLHRVPNQPTTLMAAVRFGHSDQTTLWNVGFGDSAEELGHAFRLACLGGGEYFVSAERVFVHVAPYQQDRLAIRSRADGRLLYSSPNEAFNSAMRVVGSPWGDAIVILERKQFRVYRGDELSAPPHVIRNDKRREFTSIAFHPSGKYLAVTSNDATVKLYDATTWEITHTFSWQIGKMRSICFSSDGALAAAGSNEGKVVVWDMDL